MSAFSFVLVIRDNYEVQLRSELRFGSTVQACLVPPAQPRGRTRRWGALAAARPQALLYCRDLSVGAGNCWGGGLPWGVTIPSPAIPERHIRWQTQGSELR